MTGLSRTQSLMEGRKSETGYGKAELIYYMRSDAAGPTVLRYKRYNATDPQDLGV